MTPQEGAVSLTERPEVADAPCRCRQDLSPPKLRLTLAMIA